MIADRCDGLPINLCAEIFSSLCFAHLNLKRCRTRFEEAE
jgi:hypothetical protein